MSRLPLKVLDLHHRPHFRPVPITHSSSPRRLQSVQKHFCFHISIHTHYQRPCTAICSTPKPKAWITTPRSASTNANALTRESLLVTTPCLLSPKLPLHINARQRLRQRNTPLRDHHHTTPFPLPQHTSRTTPPLVPTPARPQAPTLNVSKHSMHGIRMHRLRIAPSSTRASRQTSRTI